MMDELSKLPGAANFNYFFVQMSKQQKQVLYSSFYNIAKRKNIAFSIPIFQSDYLLKTV